MMNQRVGILALQGDFSLHQRVFEHLGAQSVLIKRPDQLAELDRLVIPGGEATTIQLLLDKFDFRKALIDFAGRKPVWGTCAGLILLADRVTDPLISPLRLIAIEVERNAYGRQINSFIGTGIVSLGNREEPLEMVFIRAPKILKYSAEVIPLGKHGDDVTIARQNNILVSTFHPELTDRTIVHEYFLGI
jgi:5'-phosphate synthase pdxT subunit